MANLSRSGPADAIGWVRDSLARQVLQLLVGADEPALERRGATIEDDPGYFGPDSVTWRVHEDSCTIAGGIRALMLQTMHPLAIAGVAEHSNYRDDPLIRLANTGAYVGTAIYGTQPEVRDVITRVKRVHERVVGVAPDGRPYAANDPHLLTFVHHTLVDSFLRSYQRYGSGRLSATDADRYVDEQAVIAELFGGEPAARSVAELRTYFHELRPELRATAEARDTIRFLLLPPLPLIARGPYAVMVSAAITMLPRWIRRELWLPVPPALEPLVVRPAATALVRTVDWVMHSYAPSEIVDRVDQEGRRDDPDRAA